jgi:hypothetical protein
VAGPIHGNLDLALRRFKMSPPPTRGEDKYEEKLTNWFLEGAFFRDFVFREQVGKGGRGDLADGLVLFDGTALFVQSKAQAGDRDGRAWAAKNIGKALAQVGYGERMLRDRLVPQVVSDTLGPVAFDPDRYKERIGLIVLDQDDTTPFEASALVPEVAQQPFPVHVLSLPDLMELATRFDTASDFLWYLEERRQFMQHGLHPLVHREQDVAVTMFEHAPARLRQHRPGLPADVFERSLTALRRKLTGDLRDSEDWRYSILVDDIIARLHERDPAIPWNEGGTPQDIITAIVLLSDLDRARRAEIGRRLHNDVSAASDGEPRWHTRATRHNRCCYVFLASDMPREERLRLAHGLLLAGIAHSGMDRGLVVATNSTKPGGRAYDVAVHPGPLSEEERAAGLACPSPFSS